MQKFNKGDHVQIAKDLGLTMRHFTSDCEAIIIGSYRDQYNSGSTDSYTVHIKGEGNTSWYYESQLALISKNRIKLLAQWEGEEKQEEILKSDLRWIFNHGSEVLESAHGATIEALANCFGLTNLWGRRGEGSTYCANAAMTLGLAEKFLKNGDKDGWLEYCNNKQAQDI